MVKVTKVPKEDIPLIAEIGRSFHNEVPSIINTYNTDITIQSITALLDGGIGRLYGLVEDDKYVGVLLAIVAPDLFTGVLSAKELAWYVKPEHRRYGIKLLRRFEEDAVNEGVSSIFLCHLVDSMPDKVARLYTKLGYSKQDVIYRKDL